MPQLTEHNKPDKLLASELVRAINSNYPGYMDFLETLPARLAVLGLYLEPFERLHGTNKEDS